MNLPQNSIYWKLFDLPQPEVEYRFHGERKWRFDFVWPEFKVAVEVNGGVFVRGRHVRGQGYINDMEKLNEAQLLGYIVLQFTPDQIKTGWGGKKIKEALIMRGFHDLSTLPR